MTSDIKGMISLSESGYILWQAMNKGADSVADLVDVLLETYDVDRDTATKDVNEILNYLTDMGVIEE
jgi:hypothetical protein